VIHDYIAHARNSRVRARFAKIRYSFRERFLNQD